MRKKLWVLLTIALLLGSFLVPWGLLRWQEARALEEVYTLDAQALQFSGEAVALADKLQILGAESAQSLSLPLSVDERSELYAAFYRELELLTDAGAVSPVLLERVSDKTDCSLNKVWLVSLEKRTMFEACWVHCWSRTLEIDAVLDLDSGRLLSLQATGQPSRYLSEAGDLSFLLEGPAVEERIRAWAAYYGLRAESVWVSPDGPEKQLDRVNVGGVELLAAATLTDETGAGCRFCLRFLRDLHSGTLAWRPEAAAAAVASAAAE